MKRHQSVPVYRGNPYRFLQEVLRPGKVDTCATALEWHCRAAEAQQYELEPFDHQRRQQLTYALTYLMDEQPVTIEALPYGNFRSGRQPPQFFHHHGGLSLHARLAAFFHSRNSTYTTFIHRELMTQNIAAIFGEPLAATLSEQWPTLGKLHADSHEALTLHGLFAFNLQRLIATRIATFALDAQKPVMNLAQHLLDATRYCFPLCSDLRDPQKWYVVTA